MKKVYFLMFFLFSVAFLGFSQEFSKPFEFSVFDMNEAGEIFQGAMPYFSAMAKNDKPSEDAITRFLSLAYSKELSKASVTELFLRAHFRETENSYVRKMVEPYFNKLIPQAESFCILNRYKSKKNTMPNGKIEYSYKNMYDDDFLFHMLSSHNFYNEKLIVYFPAGSTWDFFV